MNKIQGKSKPNPNWPKLSKIQPSPTESNPGKSLDFLVRIEPYQGLARTPQGVFSFACPVRPHRLAHVGNSSSQRSDKCCPVRPHRLAHVGPPPRPGAFLVSMSTSFNYARSAALSFLECIMAQFSKICKENVDKSPKRPEFRAFEDAAATRRGRSSHESSSRA
jgi:hypothetical protein